MEKRKEEMESQSPLPEAKDYLGRMEVNKNFTLFPMFYFYLLQPLFHPSTYTPT
jgi:hypothetical protein